MVLTHRQHLIDFLNSQQIKISEVGHYRRWPVVIQDPEGNVKDVKGESAERYGLRTLMAMNSLLNASVISVGGVHLMAFEKVSIRLIKSGDENEAEHYGRLHGPIWHLVRGGAREHITINGLGVVEVDICSAFPAAAYATHGLDITKSFNKGRKMYDVPCLNTAIRGQRSIAKSGIMCLMNATSHGQAVQALNGKLNKNSRRLYLPEGVKAGQVIDELMARHQKMDEWFFSESWKKLSMTESNICIRVLTHFIEKDVPVLTVHDSFIIQLEYKQELIDVLQRSIEEECGIEFEHPGLLCEEKLPDITFGGRGAAIEALNQARVGRWK